MLRGARDCRSELGIVGTAAEDRLLFDEGLILSIQIQTHLDRDRAVYAELPFINQRVHEVAHFSAGIRVQLECPFDAITRWAAICSRLETPLAEPRLCHVQGQVALQVVTLKPRQP